MAGQVQVVLMVEQALVVTSIILVEIALRGVLQVSLVTAALQPSPALVVTEFQIGRAHV